MNIATCALWFLHWTELSRFSTDGLGTPQEVPEPTWFRSLYCPHSLWSTVKSSISQNHAFSPLEYELLCLGAASLCWSDKLLLCLWGSAYQPFPSPHARPICTCLFPLRTLCLWPYSSDGASTAALELPTGQPVLPRRRGALQGQGPNLLCWDASLAPALRLAWRLLCVPACPPSHAEAEPFSAQPLGTVQDM